MLPLCNYIFSQRIEALSSLKPEAPNASSIRKNQFPIQCYFQQHPFNRSSMCTISMPEIYLAPGLHYTPPVSQVRQPTRQTVWSVFISSMIVSIYLVTKVLTSIDSKTSPVIIPQNKNTPCSMSYHRAALGHTTNRQPMGK